MSELRRSFAMSHLPFSYSLDGGFIQPFLLGSDDASGDNITHKPAFSEGRGHYWLWKNIKFADEEFVSIQQYRRCFLFFPLLPAGGKFARLVDTAHKYLGQTVLHMTRAEYIEYAKFVDSADKTPLNYWLRDIDMVVGRPIFYERSVAQMYREHHRAQDWEVFAHVCRKRGFDDGRHNCLTAHLMFIMRPELFDRYMTDWWSVMSEVDAVIQHEADPYQHRKIGYLSERFLSAWLIRIRIEQPTLRIQTLPICEGLLQLDRPHPGVM